MNTFDILNQYYTQIKNDKIELHKDIEDENIMVSFQFRQIYIFDKNDIVYMDNSNSYISFHQTPTTLYTDKFLKLEHWNNTNVVYPYLLNKTIEEMDEEQCKEIKIKNYLLILKNAKFLEYLKQNKHYTSLSFIIKLNKINNSYFLSYYVKNTLLEHIKSGRKEQILKDILCDTEKNLLIEKKTQELNSLMESPVKYNCEDNCEDNCEYNCDVLKPDINLYNYQKNDVNWMKHIEQNVINQTNKIEFNYSKIQSVLNDQFVLLNDTLLQSELINKDIDLKHTFSYNGGNLISEVGLGKTIIALYHILNDKEYNNKRIKYNNYVEFSNCCNYFYKRGNKKGMACGKECTEDNLFCQEHISTLFVDKRELIYKNTNNFNPNDFLSKMNNKINTNSTLIICPNHLCDQWVREYYDKFKNDKRILLLITKDQFNNLTLGDILFSDIVITSYSFLTSKWYLDLFYESMNMPMDNFKLNEDLNLERKHIVQLFMEKKQFNELSLFNWNRVILDEAHEIQEMPKIRDLKHIIESFYANFKWNISGTPFSKGINGFLELMSYNTSFKSYTHSCYMYSFTELLSLYLKSNIIDKSRFLFKRNTKKSIEHEINKNIINQHLKLLEFTEEERSIYTSYEKGNKAKFTEFLIKLCCHCELNSDTKTIIKKCKTLNEIKNALLSYNELQINILTKNKTNYELKLEELKPKITILENYINRNEEQDILLDDYKITSANYKRQITNITKNIESLTRTLNYLKNSIESTEQETCTICLESVNDSDKAITKCGHKFCWECIQEIFKTNIQKCPNCNSFLNKDDIYVYTNEYQEKQIKNDNLELNDIIHEVKSTKIGNIIYFLNEIFQNKQNDKVIIFSQWDLLLEKVADILSKYNLKTTHCKGTVYQKKRAIKEFTSSKDTNIIMLSSRNAASGINLTEANKIILLEPVYGNKEYRTNIENQAIGRSDRIGQKRPIDVYKFIIKNTIEEDIINNILEEENIPHINF